jgi:hypothetical protein
MFLINPYIFASGGSYLLDTYSGADLAFSTRRLSSTYMGACLRVRRSSDNSELDIGFVGGDLDTAAISTFCGGGIGYVAKWYNQNGGGFDLFNTTAANQPVIYNNGFTLRNGKPYIQATATRWLYFTSAYIMSANEDYSLWMTYEKSNTNNNAILYQSGSSYMWMDYGASQYVNSSNTVTISPQYLANTLYLNNTISDYSLSTKIYQNNVLIGSRGASTTGGQILFVPAHQFRSATITYSELIWYKSDKTSDASAISSNINDYFSIY